MQQQQQQQQQQAMGTEGKREWRACSEAVSRVRMLLI